MLKRHLMTHYNLTPDQYRQKWGLSGRLPDGRAQLRRTTAYACQVDRSWYQAQSHPRWQIIVDPPKGANGSPGADLNYLCAPNAPSAFDPHPRDA